MTTNLVVLIYVLIAAISGVLNAQTSAGSLTGTVADSSGQVIPEAMVTLTSERNGEERRTTTSSVGDFVFAALVPGPYTVKVEAEGFKAAGRRENNALSSARVAVGTVSLEVGEVTESVTVTSQGALVQRWRT